MEKNGFRIKMLDWDLGHSGSVPIHVSDCPMIWEILFHLLHLCQISLALQM